MSQFITYYQPIEGMGKSVSKDQSTNTQGASYKIKSDLNGNTHTHSCKSEGQKPKNNFSILSLISPRPISPHRLIIKTAPSKE